MSSLSTQVGIIGAGPAGLFLSRKLHLLGIDNVVLEHKSRSYVENRLRAGLLEQNTTDMMAELGVDHNLKLKVLAHHGVMLSFNGDRVHIPFEELTGGRRITIYGQEYVVRDFIAKLVDEEQRDIRFEASALEIRNIHAAKPSIVFIEHEEEKELMCDFVVACDGYHGIGRQALQKDSYRTHEIEYPYSWLGILAETPPSSDELIYAFHEEGFALLSYRSPSLSRLYIQVDNDDHIDHWSDDRIWQALEKRLGSAGWKLNTGPIIQKSITPMRSFMIDKMQEGRLFIAGDAAHIVPPTGGKGLNLAVADIRILSDAFERFYDNGDTALLEGYSNEALKRIWRAQHFSNFMTRQFHRQFESGSFEYQLQKSQFDYIKNSVAMRTTIAENYVGLKHID